MFTDFCCSLFLSLALSESGHFSLNVNGFQVWWAEAACTESGNGAGSFVSKRCHIFAARATGLDPPPLDSTCPRLLYWSLSSSPLLPTSWIPGIQGSCSQCTLYPRGSDISGLGYGLDVGHFQSSPGSLDVQQGLKSPAVEGNRLYAVQRKADIRDITQGKELPESPSCEEGMHPFLWAN